MNRTASRCLCKYQAEKEWGYNLQRWDGPIGVGWENVGDATHIEDVLRYAERFETVLIRCNGCGADIIREYPRASTMGDMKKSKEVGR